jgi:thiol:disulfide interchange protein DsbA
MGIEGKYTEIIYNDILKNNVDLSDEKTLDNWLVKNSIDVTAYKSVRQSQEVKDKLKFMLDVSQNYNIKATPAFIINKKWVSLQDRDYPEYSDNILSLLKTDKPLSK